MPGTAPAVVELAAGELEAAVHGGAVLTVASLRHRGEELLCAPGALPEPYRVHGTRAGITLLHPWGNRLGADAFAAAGAAVSLDGAPVTRDPAGLALHGLAIPGTWNPVAAGDSVATVHAALAAQPAFPWPHTVDVAVALVPPATLSVTTTVRAAGGAPVPIAFGWHPYLVLAGAPRAAWRLELPGRTHLRLDDRGIPSGAAEAEAAEDAPLGDRTFDDGYERIADGAVLAVADGVRRVAVVHEAGYPVAQLFAPGDRDVVSLEPMTAPTDALRSGRGLRTVAAGEAFTARFAVVVTDL